MGKNIATQVQEAQRVLQDKPKEKLTRTHIKALIKINHKEHILKTARGKEQITYTGLPIRLTQLIFQQKLQTRRDWQDMLKGMKGKKTYN